MFALVATLASGAAAQQVHAPSFFWSPSSLFTADAARESLREATGADVEATVSALLGSASPIQSTLGAPLAAANKGAKAPEVQLVFLAEGLQTDAVRRHGAVLPKLKELIDGSASSLSVPFTLPTGSKPFEGATARVAGDEVEGYLKAHSSLYTNGAPDVVVVELAADAEMETEKILAAQDALIGHVSHLVHAGTRGNYAAVLMGHPGARGAHRLLKSVVPPAAFLHTTPTLLTAQLVMLLIFVIFLSGFCCLFSLQTPKKFEENKAA